MQVWWELSLDGSQTLRRVAHSRARLRLWRHVLVRAGSATARLSRTHCLHVTLRLVHSREVITLRFRRPRLCNLELALAAHKDVVFVLKEIFAELVEVPQIWLVVFKVPLLRAVHDFFGELFIANNS